jgi:hypothetical protein
VAAGLIGLGGNAFAQEPVSLVPRIGVASTPSVAVRQQVPVTPKRATPPAPTIANRTITEPTGSARWNDFPVRQRIPLTRAAFDTSGYHLYNSAGISINVPFVNQDIHVMKFAVSPDNTTFFVNDGIAPVLYMPLNECLINTGVVGMRWYPFSAQFRPVQPVFLSIAPNYTEFISVNWYPNIVTYGGFYGTLPFAAGGVFRPTTGLTFYIGTQSYAGWSPLRDFLNSNPQPVVTRSRVWNARPRDYANRDPYNGDQNGNNGYVNDGYNRPYPTGGYVNPRGGFTFYGGGYGYPAGGYGYPGGGFGYPSGGFQFIPRGGVSMGTPGPPRQSNKRTDGKPDSGFGTGVGFLPHYYP